MSDLVTTTAKVAQIPHPGLDLGDRVGKLVLRLTHGIPGAATDLARECGSELLRGEYCALVNANVCEIETIEPAQDAAILDCVGGDKEKLSAIRDAAAAMKRRKQRRSSSLIRSSNPMSRDET
jgi:helicase